VAGLAPCPRSVRNSLASMKQTTGRAPAYPSTPTTPHIVAIDEEHSSAHRPRRLAESAERGLPATAPWCASAAAVCPAAETSTDHYSGIGTLAKAPRPRVAQRESRWPDPALGLGARMRPFDRPFGAIVQGRVRDFSPPVARSPSRRTIEGAHDTDRRIIGRHRGRCRLCRAGDLQASVSPDRRRQPWMMEARSFSARRPTSALSQPA
jgi:hypothetical protein